MILQMLDRISEKLEIPESRREDLVQLLKENTDRGACKETRSGVASG
jgi:transcription initiation factor TFIIIB Brf1 subunit/transcription initiation factor TFIIB